MAALVAKVVLYLIFGFFIYETINQFNKPFNLSLNPYVAVVPATMVCALQEFVINERKSNVKEIQIEEAKEARIDKIFFFVTWLLIAGLFLSILAVWTRVIYKQVIKGSEGSAIFHIKKRDSNSGSSRQISSKQ
jgi:hypothetical protein